MCRHHRLAAVTLDAVRLESALDSVSHRAALGPRADLNTGCDGKNAGPTGMKRSFFPGFCHPLFVRSSVTLAAGREF